MKYSATMFLILIVCKDYQHNPHLDTTGGCLWTLHINSSFQEPDAAMPKHASLLCFRVLRLYAVPFDQFIVENEADLALDISLKKRSCS